MYHYHHLLMYSFYIQSTEYIHTKIIIRDATTNKADRSIRKKMKTNDR